MKGDSMQFLAIRPMKKSQNWQTLIKSLFYLSRKKAFEHHAYKIKMWAEIYRTEQKKLSLKDSRY